MKRNIKWKILLVAGIVPFLLPFVLGVYRMRIESWAMMDWLVMYSFIYWPMYIIGFVIIVVATIKLLKRH